MRGAVQAARRCAPCVPTCAAIECCVPCVLTCRERAKLLMKGLPESPKDDHSLPANAQLFQSTLGVTSEGFQARLEGLEQQPIND